MTDLLPFAENILSHTGTASLDGESLILITPEDILLAEERENNTCSKQHERRLKLKKT